MRLRGSYSQGFRAPNLEQTNTVAVFAARLEHRFLSLRGRLRAGRIANFTACSAASATPSSSAAIRT
jgi:iron complex outermembrane receptor protein